MDILIELYELFKEKLTFSLKYINSVEEFLKTVIPHRFSEIENFKQVHIQMLALAIFLKNYITKIDKNFSLNLESLDGEIRKFQKLDEYKLSDLVVCFEESEIVTFTKEAKEQHLNSRIKHFNQINKKDLNFFKDFIQLASENVLLLNYMKQKSDNESFDLNSFIENVIKPAYEDYIVLGSQISSGDLNLEEFNYLIGKNFKESEWKSEIKRLLTYIDTDNDLIEFRIRQLDHHLKLEDVEEITHCLLSIKDRNLLDGDFEPLENIQESVS